jgi:dihydroorotate dehydrogenase (fumarate)
MDLSTGYLGLRLRNPLVASASPLSNTVDGVRRLADGGVGAVLTLLKNNCAGGRTERAAGRGGTEGFAESLSYSRPRPRRRRRRMAARMNLARAATPEPPGSNSRGGGRHTGHRQHQRVTAGWTSAARAMQRAPPRSS